jgi:hypothetical protein
LSPAGPLASHPAALFRPAHIKPLPSAIPLPGRRAEGEEMRAAARLQELQEMAAKLLATAREIPPGQDHYNALREIGRFCAQIDALQDADSRPAQLGLNVKGK